MKISKPIKTEQPIAEELLQKSLITLRKKNPDYEVFNPSTDIRNLTFMTPHLKSNTTFIKKLKKYEKELTTLYLVTLHHRPSVGSAQVPAKSFLVDIKRLYIMCLKKYPDNIEQKSALLTHYFTKKSINATILKQKTPTLYNERLASIVSSVAEGYPHLRISTIITLDKLQETGYFTLLRFINPSNCMIYQTVFELQSMKQFFWDVDCDSIREYYIKHRLLFIKELVTKD